MARRNLRLVAVLAVVLLTLTGFRPGGGGSRGGSHGGGDHVSGGGCSNSGAHAGSGSHSGTGDYDDDYDGSAGGGDYAGGGGDGGATSSPSGGAMPDAEVVECDVAEPDDGEPGSKVRIRNADEVDSELTVTVGFRDADRELVDTAVATIDPYRDAIEGADYLGDPVVEVPMAHPERSDEAVRCEVLSAY